MRPSSAAWSLFAPADLRENANKCNMMQHAHNKVNKGCLKSKDSCSLAAFLYHILSVDVVAVVTLLSLPSPMSLFSEVAFADAFFACK